MMLEEEQKKKGVIAASAGNHALALAYHGGQLGKIIDDVKIRRRWWSANILGIDDETHKFTNIEL